ncbi:MAG: hypothetical protein ACFCVC_14830 [Acidimicrobiia bacterium]
MSGSDRDVFSVFDPSPRPQPPAPPPIGSLQADIIDPPLGSVKIEDLDHAVRLWADDGESEVVSKHRLKILGQRGALLKIDWNGDPVLMDFGTSNAAIEAIETLSARSTNPDPEPSTVGRRFRPRLDVSAPEPVVAASAPKPATESKAPGSFFRLLKRAATIVAVLALLAGTVVVGIGLGSRMLGGGPAAPVEPRSSDVVIRNVGGVDGGQELSPFSVAKPWVVNWKVEGGGLVVTAIAEDGSETRVTNVDSSGDGTMEFSDVGSYRILVEADDGVQWRVIVLEQRGEAPSTGG